MGIFGNRHTHTLNEINSYVGEINHDLKEIEQNIISLNIGDRFNKSYLINKLMQNIATNYNELDVLASSLSQKEFSRLTLCWLDGRYLPIYIWDASFRMVIGQIDKAMTEAGF